MTIQYSLSALMKKVMQRGGRLQWATKVPMSEAISAFAKAAAVAYPPVDPGVATLDITGPGGGEGGPVIYVNRCEAAWIGEHFITGLATALEAAGYSGRLREAARVNEPQLRAPSVVLAAKLELDWDDLLDAGPNDAGMPAWAWMVDPERTRRVLTPWLEWTTSITEDSYLLLDAVTSKVTAPLATEMVLAAFPRPRSDHNIHLICYDETNQQARCLTIDSHGYVALESWDPARSWQDHAEALTDLATPHSEDLANAFLCNVAAGAVRSSVLSRPMPPWPLVRAQHPGALAHLEHDYLYDAHGWQLVTSRHLAHLGDLDPARWTIEQIAPDRYTVTATDLAPWLDADPSPLTRQTTPRPPVPPLDVLDQARTEFAEAIMSHQLLLDTPFPAYTGHTMNH